MGWPHRYAHAGFKGYPDNGQPEIVLDVIATPMFSTYQLNGRGGRPLLNLMIESDGRVTDLLTEKPPKVRLGFSESQNVQAQAPQ
jgi:hypothetical protein